MELSLALVVGRLDDGCSVVPVDGSAPFRAVFAAPFRRVAGSLPDGSLVALDLGPATPEVVWRWFPARVLAVSPDRLTLDEPVHGVIEADVHPELPRHPAVGQSVYVSLGLTDEWRVDAPGDDPGAAAAVLTEVDAFYARLTPDRRAGSDPAAP